MKAITLTQPWSQLVAIGAKQFETRSWRTSYRGPLAIHAAKGWPKATKSICYREPFRSVLATAGYFTPKGLLHTLPCGVVLATCELVACVRTEDAPVSEDSDERAFGDYGPGRYAWRLDNVVRLAEPIPATGMLGLWEWDGRDEAQREVERQLEWDYADHTAY